MNKTKHPPITIRIILTALVLMFAFSCVCYAESEQEPEAKPTPATPESWTDTINESPNAQKFITKKSVVKAGDVAQYPTERIVQDPITDSAVKGVKWVKTYRLWTRGDGVVIPLSNGWTAEATIDTPISVVDKPTVEVFK